MKGCASSLALIGRLRQFENGQFQRAELWNSTYQNTGQRLAEWVWPYSRNYEKVICSTIQSTPQANISITGNRQRNCCDCLSTATLLLESPQLIQFEILILPLLSLYPCVYHINSWSGVRGRLSLQPWVSRCARDSRHLHGWAQRFGYCLDWPIRDKPPKICGAEYAT